MASRCGIANAAYQLEEWTRLEILFAHLDYFDTVADRSGHRGEQVSLSAVRDVAAEYAVIAAPYHLGFCAAALMS